MDEEEFVGTGEVVRIEKTEEVTDVARHCYQYVLSDFYNCHSCRCLTTPSVTRTPSACPTRTYLTRRR